MVAWTSSSGSGSKLLPRGPFDGHRSHSERDATEPLLSHPNEGVGGYQYGSDLPIPAPLGDSFGDEDDFGGKGDVTASGKSFTVVANSRIDEGVSFIL